MPVPEKKRNAPDTGKTNDGVDNSAYTCGLTTKDPGNKIKLENANERPVQRADYGQGKCCFIHIDSSNSCFIVIVA